MTNIKGLKRIQQMIFFFSWKRQAVQRRLRRVRERLASSLFISHPIARHLLLNVRDACTEIEDEAEREYVEADTSYTLERLAHIHEQRVRDATAAITKRIQSLCVMINDATRDISRCKEEQGCSYAIRDHEEFSKTLRLSSLRERMFTFLRLVDCHVAEAIYQHMTLVVQDLRARICGQQGAAQSDDVSFEGEVHSATIHFVPSKVEVLELIHAILMKYCVALDGLPRVLTDKLFERVLTPFVPSTRRGFAESLLKPSHLVLETYEPELRQMRAALELHFRRLGILQQEHLRCIRAIKVAERESPDTRLPELPDLSSSAAAYELAQKTWSRFVRYASSAASMLQVGFLLLDERSFVDRLRSHVSKRVAEMDDALPLIYQQFLTSLLEDVDGRIDKITKIPTNLEEANAWLTQVTSMMPSRPFRQRLDTKIANLARLRILIKERGLVSLEIEAQDAIRKLELTWESVIETLLVCLARVEERGSEHRRSVHDVISKVDEYISGQLQLIIGKFEEIPSGYLVAMDIERKSVVQQFEEYDREHRASMDMPPLQQPVWTSSISSTSSKNLSAVSMTDKLPSELLLLYIITSLELRQWFESWKKMQDKWLGSPLTGVHPGTMINRIKLFRRRLAYASSRLSRLSSDFELMRVFDSSIEEMSNCNRIFQAISGGAFSEARWAAMNQLLNVNTASNGGGHLTLRLMKEKCDAGQVETFLVVCDECIVEAKLHVKLEQARQRLARIEVRVEETNYSVACEGIAEALAQLDEIAVDVNLCPFGQNPELQLCLELRADLERKVSVCEHILSYQKHWRLRCEATKLHEMDEFFSKRFSGGDFALPRGQKSHRKTGLKQEQTVWQAFLDASHAWSDRLRRLFFVSPPQVKVEPAEQNQRSLLGRKSAVAPAPMTINRRRNTAAKSMNCTLDDVIKSFEGFDFEANFAVCERGIELVHNYLASIREKAPRMYCLDESSMLRLLLRDSDVKQLHQSLAICFPQVHRFALSRAANRVGSTVEVFGKPGTSVRASKTAGTIKSGHFRLPVAKIGRVKFWFTRLEEEMSSMVLTDLKRAFEWATQDFASAELGDYDSLLPQSIVTAFGLRFTFDMNQALRSNQYETKFRQLIKVQVGLRGRLEGLDGRKTRCSFGACSSRLEYIKGERNELLPSSPDFLKIPSANHSGQPMSFSVCCQVAHLQMPLGQEFVGWRRLAVLSPFTQRCSYALFSALRMHHTALVVPYNVDRAGTAPTSLLWGIAQLLLRPCTEFACDPSAGGAATIHHIGNLMSFTSKLNGFLIVRHLVQLSTALVGAVTNLLVLPRHPGGILYGASSIFVPLESTEELQRSGLIRSVRTAFRAVAVSRPAIKYTVECMLIADGFTSEQTRELNVVEAVEAIDAGEAGPIGVSNVESLISRVIREARRLRDQYRVVLVTKGKGDEEAVAAAVTIYLESAYALPADCGQFELVMELWRALQTFPAAFVYGSPGSGKTTCITALHRALLALEMSEQNQENEDVAVIHIANTGTWKQSSSSLKWVLVDGEIDGGMLDRLLESDNRACSSASSLPSSSVLYRGQSSNVISGDYSDSSDSPRLLFEVVSVADLSPSALQKCWALHVPSHCITVASIIRGWRSRWENQPIFSPDSPGFEAMTVVFKTVDVLLSRICVPFANEEATADRTDADMAKTAGLKLGNLSLNHITQTALAMVSLCFLQNKSLLQELPYFRLVELVAFALLWGFAGHLPGPSQIKLESYVRAKSKEHSETRHLAELQRSLLDANYFEDVWAELQPSAFDSSNGHALVLVPRATSLVRVCTLLLHSSHSFLLIGPAASGKTSLLRWLMHRNTEVEAARMKMETSLDERHVHGILDWTRVPGAWFSPLNQHDTGAESRAKMREESELFATRSRHSFVFLDDLDAKTYWSRYASQ
ncbi:uncharacterized protein PITG_16110 [Phytophthora infestans T30-4]|uniref:Dynein heavy chain n=1 Tax=Phytophthora infestans (strain T30-4) TaxID=403677 RepID=D0NSX0_PHYIT|nr:uncharacterized protein PITG_16110 [Phytophthora infestans T30-4]EEY64682.1 conserved hypothetical protein [Phytophthora infestans T30-4]|eukprot:XP_002897882.1 conserved hypothetical protein [Phytophthora infestans T30-4]